MKRRLLILTAVLALGAFTLTACGGSSEPDRINIQPEASASAADTLQNSITVNSSEKISVTPDIAEVQYSVRTQDKDAAVCQQKNTESVNQVIEVLKNLGVKETSIQTSDYYMNPVYDYSNNTTRVTGYESISTMTVSDLPIDGLGDILTQSVSSGINTIQSVSYSSSSYDDRYNEALKNAVASALVKAEALAEASGRTVTNVLSIEETGGISPIRYTNNTYSTGALKQEKMAYDQAAIMPGQVDVEASIVVRFGIQ